MFYTCSSNLCIPFYKNINYCKSIKSILFLDFHRYDYEFHFSEYCMHIEYDCGHVSKLLGRNST